MTGPYDFVTQERIARLEKSMAMTGPQWAIRLHDVMKAAQELLVQEDACDVEDACCGGNGCPVCEARQGLKNAIKYAKELEQP